jgi:hypothetical protein
MLSLVVDKHRVHCALLGYPRFVELCLAYMEANGRVKRVVVANVDILHESRLRLLSVYSKPIARGNGLSKSGSWVVWR